MSTPRASIARMGQKLASSPSTILRLGLKGDDLREYQKFLYQSYCVELGWFNPADYPHGYFTDENDATSCIIGIYKEEVLVGGMKLASGDGHPFPHEDLLRKELPDLGSIVSKELRLKASQLLRSEIREVTRTIGSQKTNRLLVTDLVKCLYWYAVFGGTKAYYMVIDMNLFLLCSKIGFPITPIDIPQFCEGSWTIPGIVFVSEILPSMHGKGVEMASYVADGSNVSWEQKSI